jgi:hypothetical protein
MTMLTRLTWMGCYQADVDGMLPGPGGGVRVGRGAGGGGGGGALRWWGGGDSARRVIHFTVHRYIIDLNSVSASQVTLISSKSRV